MRSYARWRLLRPLLAFILSVSLLVSYIYLKSRPSYELYTSLSEYELEQSRKLVQNSRANKYVLFKQLQGAGFNNQASWQNVRSSQWYLISPSGSGNIVVPPLGPTNVPCIRIPTTDMASARRELDGSFVGFPRGSDKGQC